MSPSVSVRLLLTQSDARLVSFAHAGHERAFEALVRRYRRPLLGYCRRLLLSEERAEDALQQAFLQAWLALQAGTHVSEVKPWLYRIVHNASLNVLRVSGYDYCQLNDSLCGADAPQADLDRRIAVREALAGLAALPEMQREALLRTAVEGRTHQQVARDLGLSENALRGLVYRARATLRTTVGAIVPAPLLTWALGSGGRGAPIVERLSELAAGGGSAGVAGILMKGGAVAVTASVLAGGITSSVHTHRKPVSHNAAAHAAGHRRVRTATSPSLALTAVRTPSVDPATDTRRASASRSRSSPAHHAAPGRRRGSPRPSPMPFTTKIALPPSPPRSGMRDGGTRHGRDGDGGHDNGTRSPDDANRHDGGGSTGATDGGNEGHGGGSAAKGSDGGSGTHGGGSSSSNDGSSPRGTSGASSSSSGSGSTGGGSGDSSATSGGGQKGSASESGGGEAPSGAAAQSNESSGGRGD